MTYPNIQPVLNGVRAATGAAPTLTQYPQMLLAAAQSGDPEASAQIIDMLGQTTATVQASQHIAQHHESLFHHLIGGVEHAGGALLHVAGKALDMSLAPLHEVQHAYRFQHEVWTKGDPISASLATLGVLGGAAAGAAVGGGIGAKLGADITGVGEEKIAETGALGQNFQQIARHSATAKISPGRDLANLLGLHNTDDGWGKFVSGLGDASFDLTMDPVMAVGKLGQVARTSEHGLMTLPIARRNVEIRNWLLAHGYGGLSTGETVAKDGTVLVDAVDRINGAWNNPQYRRAMDNMAKAWNSKQFISQFPTYERLAPLLAANSVRTGEDVHELFLVMANNAELMTNRYGLLPSQTILRGALNKSAVRLKQVGGTEAQQETGLIRSVGKTVKGERIATAEGTVSPLTAAVAGKIRTFSGRQPYTIDKTTADGIKTLNLSTKKFDLMDPGSLTEMYQSFKFSMGDKAASALVQDLAVHQAAGDLAPLRLAWMNSHKQLLIAAGLSEDHALVQQVSRRIEDAHLKDEFYGVGHKMGHEANYITMAVPGRVDDAGEQVLVKVPAALFGHQATSQAAFPDFWAIKNSLRAMSNIGNLGGSLDEVVAAHYTNSIFKPLALVNAGFGLRVAMAEAIPAAFRYGALNMLQGRLIATHTKYDYRTNLRNEKRLLAGADAARESGDLEGMVAKTKALQDTLVGHKLAAMSKLTGGAAKLLGASDADFELAARLVEAGQGEIVWGAPRAGSHTHLEHANATDKATSRLWFGAQKSQGVRKGDGYTLLQPGASGYSGEWHTQLTRLSEEQSARNVAKDLKDLHAQGITGDEAAIEATKREAARIIDPEQYKNERNRIVRYQHQDPHQFAAARVDSVRNLLTGADGTFHNDLAAKVAAGAAHDQKALEKIPMASAPRDVPGLELLPLPPTGLYSEIINRGFKRVVDPIINHLSREPLWFQAVKEQYGPLEHLVRKGHLSADDALDHAMYRATEAILPQIHNVMLRSQFSLMARNILPFYFAQEQAMKRTAHLLSKSPEALNKYLLVDQALHDPNFIEEVDGKRSVVIPLAGPLTAKILDVQGLMGMNVQGALPVTFTGNTQSLQTVLPELSPPGVSPLLSVALNEVAKHFPEWSPEVETVLGRGAGQSAKWSLIPNQLIRNTLIAQTKDMTDRTFANAVIQSMTAAAARGQVPAADASPFEKQAFIDRMKNNARTLVQMKAAVGFLSPLSPSVTAEDFGFRDEFNKMLDSGKTYSEAVDEFLAKHGTKNISYTVSKTENTTGAYLPSTNEALQWIGLNRDLIKSHLSAAYFIPEKGHEAADGFQMYNEALNMSLRSTETPDEFLTNMYIKSGMQTYMADKQAQDEFLATLTDPEQIKQAQANWSAHVTDLKLTNVIWAADFTSDEKNLRAQAIYADMRHLFDSGQAPDSPQTSLIRDLMADFDTHAAARAIAPVKKNEDAAWDTYLDEYVKQHPEMQSVVANVFRRIDRRV